MKKNHYSCLDLAVLIDHNFNGCNEASFDTLLQEKYNLGKVQNEARKNTDSMSLQDEDTQR